MSQMDVVINGTGANYNTEAQVDSSFQAFRVNTRPTEFAFGGIIGGHFVLAATFSNTAAQPPAGSQIFSVRWADSTKYMILKRLAMTAGCTTVFTAAQLLDADIIAARSFTSNPTGGTTITPATTSNKCRSNTMSGSLFSASGNIMISSGSALTAGTQTLDTQPFGYAIIGNGSKTDVLASYGPPISLFEVRDHGQHPMIFAANEGFVVRNGVANGAAGVVKYGIIMEWVESSQY